MEMMGRMMRTIVMMLMMMMVLWKPHGSQQ